MYLPSSGLELPCNYAFMSADKRLVQKATKHLEEEGKLVDNKKRIKNEVAYGNKPTLLAVSDLTLAAISTTVSPVASDSPITSAYMHYNCCHSSSYDFYCILHPIVSLKSIHML